MWLFFSPHHLIHYANIALNNLHNLDGDIFIRIVRNRGAVVAVFNKFYCRIDGLEKTLGVDAGENEARLVERLGTLGRGTDADCRKRMSYAGEETHNVEVRYEDGKNYNTNHYNLQMIIAVGFKVNSEALEQ